MRRRRICGHLVLSAGGLPQRWRSLPQLDLRLYMVDFYDRFGEPWPTASGVDKRSLVEINMSFLSLKERLMDAATKTIGRVTPWNKGKLLGQKPPLKLKENWAIRIRL